MKELSIEEKAKRYDEALSKARNIVNSINVGLIGKDSFEVVFPELQESEDEKIRKEIISALNFANVKGVYDKHIAWLEKQDDTNEIINRDEFAQGVLRGSAINLINWIDYNVAEGNMCLSNMECKDIEDALVSGDWDKIFAYIKKKLEKQGEQNHAWTKEDKERYISCLQRLGTGNPEQPETINSKWFKEHVYPQPTWKPSDEQIDALEDAIADAVSSIQKNMLNSLYQDLKKLKG